MSWLPPPRSCSPPPTCAGTRARAMEADPPVLATVGVGDLVLLDPLSEESLLSNLRERFLHKEIYVWLGGCGRGVAEAGGALGECQICGGRRDQLLPPSCLVPRPLCPSHLHVPPTLCPPAHFCALSLGLPQVLPLHTASLTHSCPCMPPDAAHSCPCVPSPSPLHSLLCTLVPLCLNHFTRSQPLCLPRPTLAMW